MSFNLNTIWAIPKVQVIAKSKVKYCIGCQFVASPMFGVAVTK